MDFSGVKMVQFESTVILGFKPTATSIDVPISSSITATNGYKEIIATGVDAKGSPTQTKLPILVLPVEMLPNPPQ
jgi:hypothetical protein